ncbi:ribonuclease HIII [Mycoplasma suis]|uniref:ribonuclease HIII n=1 Tax=Mycoplasma suis TaxID=57372 RepID=UPI001F472443|nr:ribonuclease HIII [Mycoplasma suis]
MEAEAASDESGKGDFFGGLHVTVTLVEVEDYLKLKEANLLPRIGDSKLLSDACVYYLAPKLLEILGDKIVSISFGAKEYNKLYSKLQNLNILLSYAHNQVWTKLREKLQEKGKVLPPKTIIDQFCTKDKYTGYLRSISVECQDINIFKTKAESCFISCAISSIISRFNFLEEMASLSIKLSYSLPLGASDRVVRAFHDISEISNFKHEWYCKTHFKTYEKAIRTLNSPID